MHDNNNNNNKNQQTTTINIKTATSFSIISSFILNILSYLYKVQSPQTHVNKIRNHRNFSHTHQYNKTR